MTAERPHVGSVRRVSPLMVGGTSECEFFRGALVFSFCQCLLGAVNTTMNSDELAQASISLFNCGVKGIWTEYELSRSRRPFTFVLTG